MKLVGDDIKEMYLVGDSIYEKVYGEDAEIGDLVFITDWYDFAIVETEEDIKILNYYLDHEVYKKVLDSFV